MRIGWIDNKWLEEVKIVVFKKHPFVPKSSSSWEKAVWVEVPTYNCNMEEMRVIQFCGCGMGGNCSVLN